MRRIEPGAALRRAVLVALCAIGLVGMHQMTALAMPAAPMHEHAQHVAAHHDHLQLSQPSGCDHDGVIGHSMHEACAATVPAGAGSVVLRSAMTIVRLPEHLPPAPQRALASGVDPPDLHILSVSRT